MSTEQHHHHHHHHHHHSHHGNGSSITNNTNIANTNTTTTTTNNNNNNSGNEYEKLKAFGQLTTTDKWTRNRPLVFQRSKDKNGDLHCRLRFHLQSSERIGLVHAEAVQYNHPISTNNEDNKKWYMRWKYNKPVFTMMYIDVKGEGRHFIIKPKIVSSSSSSSNNSSKSLSLFSWLGLTK